MLCSMRKLSSLTVILSTLALAIEIAHPLAAIAQQPEGKRPPVCEGQLPTGKVKCNYEGGDNYQGGIWGIVQLIFSRDIK